LAVVPRQDRKRFYLSRAYLAEKQVAEITAFIRSHVETEENLSVLPCIPKLDIHQPKSYPQGVAWRETRCKKKLKTQLQRP